MQKMPFATRKKPSGVAVVTLGCARNVVDSQEILGRLQQQGRKLVSPEHAEVVIVNTCAFIADAKKESVDTILDLIDLKKRGKLKRIIVSGCLAQRYGLQLLPEFKDVDAIIGVPQLLSEKKVPQAQLTPAHFSYVKICESCYNHCRFCIIPKIKGKFASRTIESVTRQVQEIDRQRVKEIILIGQDITAYGKDLYGDFQLAELLRALLKATQQIAWFRLLYTYPTHITEELINLMAHEGRICKYLDVPLQHISDRILAQMGRKVTAQQTRELIAKVRKKIPGVSLRTTFIVGLPGETEKDFQELIEFVREAQFEKMGVFMFSREEGTPAYHMPDQVPERIKKQRWEILMQEQKKISEKLQKRFLGEEIEVLIDEKPKNEQNIYLGRTQFDAPEVDGQVYVHTRRALKLGDIIPVKIKDALEYDLIGAAE
jgi:ribosomal protein S12 methylthiotransferase